MQQDQFSELPNNVQHAIQRAFDRSAKIRKCPRCKKLGYFIPVHGERKIEASVDQGILRIDPKHFHPYSVLQSFENKLTIKARKNFLLSTGMMSSMDGEPLELSFSRMDGETIYPSMTFLSDGVRMTGQTSVFDAMRCAWVLKGISLTAGGQDGN